MGRLEIIERDQALQSCKKSSQVKGRVKPDRCAVEAIRRQYKIKHV